MPSNGVFHHLRMLFAVLRSAGSQATRVVIQYALLDDDGATLTFANKAGDLLW